MIQAWYLVEGGRVFLLNSEDPDHVAMIKQNDLVRAAWLDEKVEPEHVLSDEYEFNCPHCQGELIAKTKGDFQLFIPTIAPSP